MKTSLRRKIALAATMSLPLLAAVGPVQAAPPGTPAVTTCGTTITVSSELTGNLTCNGTQDGVTIAGDNVKLNLNGFTLSGGGLTTHVVSQDGFANNPAVDDFGVSHPTQAPNPAIYTTKDTLGNYVGVRILNSTQARLTGPGTVKNFAAGVLIDGGSGNSVSGITADENIGPAGSTIYGDGIVVLNSGGNNVSNNTVSNNGPFSGITILGASDSNNVLNNTVTGNNEPRLCGNPAGCGAGVPRYAVISDIATGLRIEGDGPNGEGASGNNLSGNTVTGSGNNGVIVLAICHNGGPGNCPATGLSNNNNKLSNNKVNGNGFGGPVGRDNSRVFGGVANGTGGIAVTLFGPNFPKATQVTGNQANGNSRHGIFNSTGRDGEFVNNSASNNNQSPLATYLTASDGGPSFNLIDNIPGCDNNKWNKNFAGPINRPGVIPGPSGASNAPTNQPCVDGNASTQAQLTTEDNQTGPPE